MSLGSPNRMRVEEQNFPLTIHALKLVGHYLNMIDPPLLEANQLGRSHDDLWLLQNVDFAIDGGQRVALVGPSGSGKSLLLRSLSMLDKIDAGTITWHGHSPSGNQIPDFRRQVIYLPQRPALTDGAVELWLRQPFELAVYRSESFQKQRVIDQLKKLGRDETFLSKNHRDLSGGEAQIAAVLRAVLLEPQILLLDEPTAALDDQATEQVELLIQEWFNAQPQSRSFVWVTHDRRQADRVADRIVQISQGQIQAVSA